MHVDRPEAGVDFEFNRNREWKIDGIAQWGTEEGGVINIADPVEIVFTMASVDDPTKGLELSSGSEDQIEKTDAANGRYRIKLPWAATSGLPAGVYKYEVVYKDDSIDPVVLMNLNPTEYQSGMLELIGVLYEEEVPEPPP